MSRFGEPLKLEAFYGHIRPKWDIVDAVTPRGLVGSFNREDYALRAVACMNALAGLNPERLAALLEAVDEWNRSVYAKAELLGIDHSPSASKLYSAYRALREEGD